MEAGRTVMMLLDLNQGIGEEIKRRMQVWKIKSIEQVWGHGR